MSEIEQYKGFQIERYNTELSVLRAVKINKDKLDELMLVQDKYDFFVDNMSNQTKLAEPMLIEMLKEEIDKYTSDKNAIIEEIFVNTHKGIE